MEYQKCLVELDEVLQYLSKEDINKIPIEIINGIKEQKDKDYVWKYDKTKELKEQNLDRNTIAMLAYLNMEYLVNEKQKDYLSNLHSRNEQEVEKMKFEKYNPNDIFTKNNEMVANNNVDEVNNQNNMLVKVEPLKWYSKLFRFIKNIFKFK